MGRRRGKGSFLGLKSILSDCCDVCSKKSITASAWLLQLTAMLPTGQCHINFPPWKICPPAVWPFVKILWSVVIIIWRKKCVIRARQLVYCTAVAVKCGTANSSRRGHILMCLRDLVATNECHKSAIRRLFSSPQFSHLQVPQLYKETFVGVDDDDGHQKQDEGRTWNFEVI